MQAAGEHDVVLLNSDTEVPAGWLSRLAAHAYSGPRIASVSPFSNNATICGYPSIAGGPPAFGLPVAALDNACRVANAGRRVLVPTTVGFCMYIKRAALKDVDLFDAAAFGHGYGAENDFCLRATSRGWQHMLGAARPASRSCRSAEDLKLKGLPQRRKAAALVPAAALCVLALMFSRSRLLTSRQYRRHLVP
jgi:GT2 family glycosyltransferase